MSGYTLSIISIVLLSVLSLIPIGFGVKIAFSNKEDVFENTKIIRTIHFCFMPISLLLTIISISIQQGYPEYTGFGTALAILLVLNFTATIIINYKLLITTYEVIMNILRLLFNTLCKFRCNYEPIY